MIVVTGGAGFIGSQLVAGLNRDGINDVIVVDNLKNGGKFANLAANSIADYFDKFEFREMIRRNHPLLEKVRRIFHQGACSVTTEWDGKYMLDNNFTYSKELLHFALDREIPFIYASSAAVYGVNPGFDENPVNECPVNVYGYSKLLFDNYVRRIIDACRSQVVGLRYFNVYGPGEAHKAGMASVMFHFNHQLRTEGVVRLFKGSHGYASGEQRRDFIYIDDVINVNLWMKANEGVKGIVNVGTGSARSFNDVGRAVTDWHGKGEIHYIDFPESLLASYQGYTRADLARLRKLGYGHAFTTLEDGVRRYMKSLNAGYPVTG